MTENNQELITFIDGWQETTGGNKEAFCRLLQYLQAQEGVRLNFIPRPGLTYSLRANHPNQRQKDLFVMVDVIESEPRWLSICFYGGMITDPEEKGDFVPGGLLGEDAICFDLEGPDEQAIKYIENRLTEAYQEALKG